MPSIFEVKSVHVIRLGRSKYGEAWDIQRRLFDARLKSEIPDILLLTEHEHVYTLGKGSDPNHLLVSERELSRGGVDVFHIDRGGDVTYHGPGQLVGYPIIDLDNYYRDVHRYLRDLEEVIIRTLADFGIGAHREEGYTGVWAANNKIAAIGVKVSRWITMHGFALNVHTDLSYFDSIIPCGIFHKGVTSMEREAGRPVAIDHVSDVLKRRFGEVFGVQIEEEKATSFARFLHHPQSETMEWLQAANR